MEVLGNLALGFDVALTLHNLAYCFIGALLGTLVGVLPGIGPVATISMLLPFTFQLDPASALIMLAGIYYGAHHSGSTTSIVLNMPGEPSHVVICFDGYPMAQQGRAGVALFTCAIGSFLAGCISILIITFFSPPLAEFAFKINSPDYAMMMLLALIATATLSHGALLTNLSMLAVGLLLGTVGTDLTTGVSRYTFGFTELIDGLDFPVLSVGLFAVGEIVQEIGSKAPKTAMRAALSSMIPSREDFRRSLMPILRGTGIGAIFGPLPGTGSMISSFTSYTLEKRISKSPERFGRGAIEGVAGPEAANNASALTSFIPMLTLGIPGGASMALMLGALMVQGISPGPRVILDHPDLFWGVVASMWVGNLMLLVLNLPLVGVWIRLLAMDYRLLYPAILVFCCIGVYSTSMSSFDVFVAALFGFLGFVLMALGCPLPPLIMGFIMGPMLEENFRRSMLLSNGDPVIFVSRPISAICVLAIVTIFLLYAFQLYKKSGKSSASNVPVGHG